MNVTRKIPTNKDDFYFSGVGWNLVFGNLPKLSLGTNKHTLITNVDEIIYFLNLLKTCEIFTNLICKLFIKWESCGGTERPKSY